MLPGKTASPVPAPFPSTTVMVPAPGQLLLVAKESAITDITMMYVSGFETFSFYGGTDSYDITAGIFPSSLLGANFRNLVKTQPIGDLGKSLGP